VLSDGKRLAIGTVYNTDTYANFDNPVKGKVYELDWELQPSDWKMIGNMTDYSPPVNQSDLSTEAYYYYRYYAVLSGNGQVLVIIKIKINSDLILLITNANGIYDAELSYTTHKWNLTIGSWNVMDDKGGLLSETQENQFASLDMEKCFALSDDGTVVGVCSKLSIAVFSWNADKSSWIPRDVIFYLNNLSRTLTV
jgi:hypothetical protein